jgi:hypothetical protein
MSSIDDFKPRTVATAGEHVRERLTQAVDLEDLERLIRELCGPVCRLRRLDLIPDPATGTVVCRLEPDVREHGTALGRIFGGTAIGAGIYFDIPGALRPDTAGGRPADSTGKATFR